MSTLDSVRQALRVVKRTLGVAGQAAKDLSWHRRFDGDGFPPVWKRALEQTRLLAISGINGEDYYNHGLYRDSFSFEEKAAFLGNFGISRYFDVINPPLYNLLARDKALFHIVAASLGVPVPEVLATTGAQRAPSVGVRLDDVAAVRSFLSSEDAHDLFLKPAGGSLGEGAMSLGSRVPGDVAWRQLPGNQVVTLQEVLEHLQANGALRRFLIQRRVRPHPTMDAIVPDVCSTVRLMTYTDSAPVVLGAALRLGNGMGPTDNLSGGGVVALIDKASGELGDAVNIDSGIPRRSATHPRTGALIAGVKLPYWDEILRLAHQCAIKFSFIPCIGWDIGITDGGPIIIEMNTKPRCRPVQIAQDSGLLAGPLGLALLRRDGIANSGLSLRRVLRDNG